MTFIHEVTVSRVGVEYRVKVESRVGQPDSGVAYEYHDQSCLLEQENTSSSIFNTLGA